jgi:hypothetical protein
MSPDARLMCDVSLILIPAVIYGGVTILGLVPTARMVRRGQRI